MWNLLTANNKDTRTTSITVLMSLLLTLNRFYALFWCFQVPVGNMFSMEMYLLIWATNIPYFGYSDTSKKRLWLRYFPEFCEIVKNSFFTEHPDDSSYKSNSRLCPFKYQNVMKPQLDATRKLWNVSSQFRIKSFLFIPNRKL